jgi:hypothetical protein
MRLLEGSLAEMRLAEIGFLQMRSSKVSAL